MRYKEEIISGRISSLGRTTSGRTGGCGGSGWRRGLSSWIYHKCPMIALRPGEFEATVNKSTPDVAAPSYSKRKRRHDHPTVQCTSAS